MTNEEIQAIRSMMEQVMDGKLAPVHEKLDRLQQQMDVVYEWVDGIDIKVKDLQKNA